jgi:type II secretory pathway pseudopilin PulG
MPFPIGQRGLRGFAFLELLVAVFLAGIVAATLALLLRSLLVSRDVQADRQAGPLAVRSALRTFSRELSCAFAPPDESTVPLRFETSTEPGRPLWSLAFFLPEALPSSIPGACDVLRVAYELHALPNGKRELLRISSPCSGPLADAPVTNRLCQARFDLDVQPFANGSPADPWPPPNAAAQTLPSSVRFVLLDDRSGPASFEILLQSAHPVRSPLERPQAATPAPLPEPLPKP